MQPLGSHPKRDNVDEEIGTFAHIPTRKDHGQTMPPSQPAGMNSSPRAVLLPDFKDQVRSKSHVHAPSAIGVPIDDNSQLPKFLGIKNTVNDHPLGGFERNDSTLSDVVFADDRVLDSTIANPSVTGVWRQQQPSDMAANKNNDSDESRDTPGRQHSSDRKHLIWAAVVIVALISGTVVGVVLINGSSRETSKTVVPSPEAPVDPTTEAQVVAPASAPTYAPTALPSSTSCESVEFHSDFQDNVCAGISSGCQGPSDKYQELFSLNGEMAYCCRCISRQIGDPVDQEQCPVNWTTGFDNCWSLAVGPCKSAGGIYSLTNSPSGPTCCNCDQPE